MAQKTHCPRGHPYGGDNLYINGGRRRCKTCLRVQYKARSGREEYRAQNHAYYLRNKDKVLERAKQRYKEKGAEIRRNVYYHISGGVSQRHFVEGIKLYGCERCGTWERWLDFHHREPEDKDFNIQHGGRAWPTLLAEIEKCDVLCRSCHKKIHFEMARRSDGRR